MEALAVLASKASRCVRRKVGAVHLDSSGFVVGVGFNHIPDTRYVSCIEVCPRAASNCAPGSAYDAPGDECYAVHAEVIAAGDRTGGMMLITSEPCPGCQVFMKARNIEWRIV